LPSIAEALRQVTASGEPTSMDIKSPDGQKTLQIHMSAVNDENEKTDGAIMLITDVTTVRLAEQIRSEFVANASHELKTPLTSIKGFSELIDTGIISDPGKAREYLEHIRIETERMIGLINDILKLSELESTTTDSGKVQVSLKLIAQKVCDSLVNQISRKGVTVTVEGEIGSIEANPEHMEQMVLNLVDNAVKYNRPGGFVKVKVEQNTENVCIKVSDSGVGIPKESRDRVFERFYRVDKSRSRKLGGTGLGLSIVKHIVGLYKGSISLESEEGVGTTIGITLPYSTEE
jgi:two-component system phosphate regulon sensor histidine kinase PhoR